MKDQNIFCKVTISLIHITISLYNVWVLLGENWRWSLLSVTGLRRILFNNPLQYKILLKDWNCTVKQKFNTISWRKSAVINKVIH